MNEAKTLEELYMPIKPNFIKRHDKNGYYITSEDLAELLKLNHHSIKNMINKNFNELASLSPANAIRFNPRQYLHGGRPEHNYYLNEFQATLLILLARPSKASNKAKVQVIKTMGTNDKRYRQYRKFTQLLLKQVTGMNAKQLKTSRHVKNAMDGLTTSEQAKYQQLENIVIGFIGLNKTYDQIKGILLLTNEVV